VRKLAGRSFGRNLNSLAPEDRPGTTKKSKGICFENISNFVSSQKHFLLTQLFSDIFIDSPFPSLAQHTQVLTSGSASRKRRDAFWPRRTYWQGDGRGREEGAFCRIIATI